MGSHWKPCCSLCCCSRCCRSSRCLLHCSSSLQRCPRCCFHLQQASYTSYAGHHLGYSGILGYNRHIVAKREADSEADAYTPAQVALGLPYANAVATGNAHNPGYITNAVVPTTTYSHAVPATTYSHAVPATTYSVPAAVRATVPYATGYAGHLGYGYGLRSSLWV